MISLKVMQRIEPKFLDMSVNQIRIVPLLASERMWSAFLAGLHPYHAFELKYCVRNCMDIMWDYILDGPSSAKKEMYEDALSALNDLSDDNEPLEEFITPFPPYLIDQLFSGIISTDGENLANICAATTVRTLDMICDNIFDQINNTLVIDTHPSVLSEINRIENDITLAKKCPLNIPQIIQIRDSYKLLQIVPVAM